MEPSGSRSARGGAAHTGAIHAAAVVRLHALAGQRRGDGGDQPRVQHTTWVAHQSVLGEDKVAGEGEVRSGKEHQDVIIVIRHSWWLSLYRARGEVGGVRGIHTGASFG